ncbi:MAG: aminotransferase class I/II-fold pyridoxal phosphate-dependent enzyme [Saprospiraceae bacterium]|nr:aminotransferase class I/II-fold pyridoxal phosphate-dependent enzyme [Saprospiraceae bacterium]
MINFFNDYLLKAQQRIAIVKQKCKYLLDKNEQTLDLNHNLKEQVLRELRNANWNRYPDSDHKDIESKIAEYCGLNQENILLSAGSASIITTLLNYFALNGKTLFITQPSYSLFDYHCKTYNINYQPWMLSSNLEYNYENIPNLGKNSVLIITSPNNPVGNTFDIKCLEHLLQLYPESMIIVDAVYCEFGNVDYTPLVKKFKNLIVLRSFSKAFPVAGLRLGYLCASREVTTAFRKLFLQYSISYFSLIFARNMLFTKEFLELSKSRIREIISEREKMFLGLNSDRFANSIKVYPSQGNFLLIQILGKNLFHKVTTDLLNNGIKVLDLSNVVQLDNTLRVSIGTREENKAFMNCIQKSLNAFYFANQEQFSLAS